MAVVTVEIPGIGEVEAKNAASEQTLRDILKALGGKRIGAGPNTPVGVGGPGVDPKKLNELGVAAEYATGEVSTFGKKLKSVSGGIFSLLNATIAGTVGAAVNLGKELIAGGNTLTDFAQHLPIPGLTMLSGVIDNQVELFRELSSTGASFGNNMFEVVRVAGNAGIPLQDFANMVTQSAERLRLFGPTVEGGSRQFASLSKDLRNGAAGQRLLAMGLSTQELNEGLINFNELIHVTGRSQRTTNKDLVDGTAAYSMELDKIAKLTGVSRKQLAQDVQARLRDINFQMAVSREGPKFATAISQASAGSKDLANALVDMSTGLPQDEMTQAFMLMSDTFKNQAQDVQNMSESARNNFAVTVGREMTEYANSFQASGVKALTMQGGLIGQGLQAAASLNFLKETSEGAGAAADKEQKAVDMATEKVAQFGNTVNHVRGRIQVDLLDSMIFQDLKNGLASIIPNVNEADDLYDKAKEALGPFIEQLNEAYLWLKNDGKKMLIDGFNSTMGWLDTKGRDMVVGAMNIFKEIQEKGFLGYFGIQYEEIKKKIKDTLTSWLPDLPSMEEIEKKFDELVEKLKGMMPDIPTIEEIKLALKEGIESLKDAIPTMADMKQVLTDIKDYFVKKIKEFLDFILPDIPDFQEIKDNVKEKIEGAGKALDENVVQPVVETSKTVKNAIVDGFQAGKNAVGAGLDYITPDFLKNDDEKPAEPKPKMSAEDRRSARHGNRNNNSDISNSMIEEQKETNKLLKKMVNKDNNVMTGVQ
jgi:hypothetical protein